MATDAQVLLTIAGLAAGAIGRDLAPVKAKSVTKAAATKTVAAAKKVVPKPKPKPLPAEFAMYDAVNVYGIPINATHVAGYLAGAKIRTTLPALKARFPKAVILTIAVTAEQDAECLDIEKGDATPEQAPAWVKRQLARGVKHPKLYADRSTMPTLWAALQAAGIKRDQVKLWVADWTNVPHRPAGYDACQWISTPGYDESLCAPRFLT